MSTQTRANHEPAVLGAVARDEAPSPPVGERSLLGLVELLLKAPAQLDAWTRDPSRQAELIPRLLMLVLTSFSLFSAVLVLLFRAAHPETVPFLVENWSASVGPSIALGLAYPVGMVAAAGICLPTCYFFALLAGVRISVLQVTTHLLKGASATAVLLLGLTPIYLSIALGMLIFHAEASAIRAALSAGLALPFFAGLWGVRSIYLGFLGLADTLAEERRCRRTCFLRRLTVAWAAVYTIVTPVMIWSIYQNLALCLE